MHLRSKEAFLLLHGELSEVDRIRMALGMYALHRLVNRLRHEDLAPGTYTPEELVKMLTIWVHIGAEGSRAQRLLHRPATSR